MSVASAPVYPPVLPVHHLAHEFFTTLTSLNHEHDPVRTINTRASRAQWPCQCQCPPRTAPVLADSSLSSRSLKRPVALPQSCFKASFSKPLKAGKRCVVVMEGFYEWHDRARGTVDPAAPASPTKRGATGPATKQPYFVRMPPTTAASDDYGCEVSGSGGGAGGAAHAAPHGAQGDAVVKGVGGVPTDGDTMQTAVGGEAARTAEVDGGPPAAAPPPTPSTAGGTHSGAAGNISAEHPEGGAPRLMFMVGKNPFRRNGSALEV
jgi:hypothetical protein